MIKVLCACGNGMGTSLMMKLKVEKILKEIQNQPVSVNSCSVSEAETQAANYDMIVCSTHLADSFAGKNVKVLALKNILDEAEITKKLKEIL